MKRSSVTLRVAPLLAAGPILLAPAGATVEAQQSGPVVPGIALHVVAVPGPDTVVLRRSLSRQGTDSVMGIRTVVSRIVVAATGQRLLVVEQRFPGGGGEIVDTAISELTTMRAVAHRSHQPSRAMQFDFVGSEVVGALATTGPEKDGTSTTRQVHQAIGGPIFDSNVLEMVVAALPLRRDFEAVLPLFIYERGGRVETPVAVRAHTRVHFPVLGTREAWIVTLDLPGVSATIWVDTATRAVLRTRYEVAARGVSFTDDRVTPLSR